MSIRPEIYVSTVVVRGDSVLMIKEGKNNYGQRGTWNLPSGHAEYGESLQAGAIREAKEETGYDIELDGIVAVHKKDINQKMNLIVFFRGTTSSQPSANPEDGTDKVEFVPLGDMASLNLRFPELVDVAEKALNNDTYPLDSVSYGQFVN